MMMSLSLFFLVSSLTTLTSHTYLFTSPFLSVLCLLVPMTNAAGAQRVLIGVFEENLVELMAQTLVEVGTLVQGPTTDKYYLFILTPPHLKITMMWFIVLYMPSLLTSQVSQSYILLNTCSSFSSCTINNSFALCFRLVM